MNNLITYNNGEIEVAVSVDKNTIWLSTEDIAILFDVQRPAIVKHIGNIYKTCELEKASTCSILEQVAKDGKKRKVNYYNLDMIISVGYRVNSVKATQFRIWATKILRQYIYEGYAINSEKITHERFVLLENEVKELKFRVNDIKDSISSPLIKTEQGVFYDGQIFDAWVFVNNLIKSAQSSIILIDNYVDESILTLFSKNQNIKVKIYTKNISKQLKLDLNKYNAQYKPIEIVEFKYAHDRFLIIDDKIFYHIGASLKDLGKKLFAFSKLNIDTFKLKERIRGF
ncbi:MAG: DNA-binding protein [Bacteroidetes bacterium 4484_276]|nr:MAG: DNA-binding protein [Bacteroidetes bacterium 4484_276]